MKIFTLILIISAFFSAPYTAKAQHAFSVTEYKKRLGKIDTLCDRVYAVNIVNDTLTILAMGGPPGHQKYNIAVKGTRVNMDFTGLKDKRLCVIATFMMNNGQPEVVATRANEFIIDSIPPREGM